MFTVWFVVAMFAVFAGALAYADLAETLRKK
jgi:hypothetical protein